MVRGLYRVPPGYCAVLLVDAGHDCEHVHGAGDLLRGVSAHGGLRVDGNGLYHVGLLCYHGVLH